MRVIVIGGGVIGVTTAYQLARDGHEVVVVERNERLAQEASSTNAGLIAPSHSFAWASPAAPMLLLRSLRGEATAIRVKPRLDLGLVTWGVRFLRECTAARARRNTLVKLRLCQYSQQQLESVAEHEGIDYQQSDRGALYLYRTKDALRAGAEKMRLLQDHGQDIAVLDPAEAIALDRGLEPMRNRIAGAIYGRTDASGNSELFTQRLADRCVAMGVTFHVGTNVTRLHARGERVISIGTGTGRMEADAFVLAAGIRSPSLARTVGQALPIYPAKGYSLTAAIKNPAAAPTIGGVDEATLVAWSRMGRELRMSSTAEFAGDDPRWTRRDFTNILKTAGELFPEAADWDGARLRSCMRPMTPDGPPIIGVARHTNLFYNAGHGHMGWTMACGSARILADLIAGQTPQISTIGLEAARYRQLSPRLPH